MNKIEPGCRAVIVNYTQSINGKVVTVLGVAGPPGMGNTNSKSGQRWSINKELPGVGYYTETIKSFSVWHIGEINLQRINDDDSRKVVSWEALKDIWVPEKETVLTP